VSGYLTFTEGKLQRLLDANDLWRERRALGWPHIAVDDLLRGLDRGELARRASGNHEREADALAYAQREGPAIVLCPDGRVLHVERVRDAVIDAVAAAEERAYSERLRRMTFRDRVGPIRRW
jgi:hypothetical protein